MCGIVGAWTSRQTTQEEFEEGVVRMRDTLVHRGPDDVGLWATRSDSSALALGFRRLAILDLSELGHQPMLSASRRFTMVFNGEVYNFADLRRELEAAGVRFRGHSDTEVMLAAFEAWGVESAVTRFVGMFAFAVWDATQRRLYLTRDRLGIKPLYVYAHGGVVLFASELKALRVAPGFDGGVNRQAVVSYLRHLYVPAPASIMQNVKKLPPGHLLTIDDPAAALPDSKPYWTLEDAARRGLAAPFSGSEAEALEELDRLLSDAVKLRLQADVPLGALLSGGIDSSLVVSLMCRHAAERVKTFTIGFDVAAHDESAHAAAVAQHLGTEHTALRLTGADALDVVPMLPEMFDEPLADPSQIPTYLVSRLARTSVTVALTGDGGDELFGGYNRYTYGNRLIPRLVGVPVPVRRAAAAAIAAVGPVAWERVSRVLGGQGLRLPAQKAEKLSRLLGEPSATTMYRSLVSMWDRPAEFVSGGTEPDGQWERSMNQSEPAALLERMMLTDQRYYLPDDLLAKVDRCSMAVSLEARVPILDHRVVEFSWRLPARFKIQDGEGKRLLRKLLYRHVPRALVDRPKVGFSVPIDSWLRGPLRGWAEDLLTADRLRADGILDERAVRRAWAEFKAGRNSHGLGIWTLLTFQAWMDHGRG